MLEARPFPLEHLHRIPEQKPQQDINAEQQQKRKHKRRTDKEQERRGAVGYANAASSAHTPSVTRNMSNQKPAAIPVCFFVLPPKTKQTLRAAAALS